MSALLTVAAEQQSGGHQALKIVAVLILAVIVLAVFSGNKS